MIKISYAWSLWFFHWFVFCNRLMVILLIRHDLAIADMDDAVGMRRDIRFVRDENDCFPLLGIKRLECVHDDLASL